DRLRASAAAELAGEAAARHRVALRLRGSRRRRLILSLRLVRGVRRATGPAWVGRLMDLAVDTAVVRALPLIRTVAVALRLLVERLVQVVRVVPVHRLLEFDCEDYLPNTTVSWSDI